jgi:hypothetical protein
MPVRFQHLEIDPSKPIRAGFPVNMLSHRPGVISTACVALLALAACTAVPRVEVPRVSSAGATCQSAGIANRWFFCLLY